MKAGFFGTGAIVGSACSLDLVARKSLLCAFCFLSFTFRSTVNDGVLCSSYGLAFCNVD